MCTATAYVRSCYSTPGLAKNERGGSLFDSGRNVAGPISAMSILALFVVLLVLLEPGPAGAQDQYADQYQQPQYADQYQQPTSSSTVPDYTPDPPVGCFSWPDTPQEGQICVDGTEPERLGGWHTWQHTTGEQTIYEVQIYTLGPSNTQTANEYSWTMWGYMPSVGWFLTR